MRSLHGHRTWDVFRYTWKPGSEWGRVVMLCAASGDYGNTHAPYFQVNSPYSGRRFFMSIGRTSNTAHVFVRGPEGVGDIAMESHPWRRAILDAVRGQGCFAFSIESVKINPRASTFERREHNTYSVRVPADCGLAHLIVAIDKALTEAEDA